MTPNFLNLHDMANAPKDGTNIVLLFIVEGKWFLCEGHWNGKHWAGYDSISERIIEFISPVRWAHHGDFLDRFEGA